jgi:putative ABC transport system permease protein
MFRLATFFRFWTWFSFRQLRTHFWRTIAVLVGISLGAAVFTSVRLAVNASLDSFTRSVDTLSGKSDWSVLSPGGRVPESLISTLLKHPAVKALSPLSTTYVQPVDNATAGPILLIGLDPILDRSVRTWQPDSSIADQSSSSSKSEARNQQINARVPSAPVQASSPWLDLITETFTLIAGEKLYLRLPLQAGHLLTLDHPQGRRTFRVLGKLAPEGLALLEGSEVAVTDLATFQEFTGSYGYVDRIDLVLQSSAPADAPGSLRALLPDGITLEQPSDLKESGRLMVRSYELNLSVLSFVSLFVGMFLVYSLISLHATSRRHELAILRSIGASSRLICVLFLTEGAFFGCLGWLLALPLGSYMVKHLLGHVSATISHLFLRVQVDRLILEPEEIFLSFATTLLVSLLAAWQPAREAMRVAPREVLQTREFSPGDSALRRNLAWCGLVLIGLVWPLSRLPGNHGVPLAGYAATFFLFAGFSLIAPWLLQGIGFLAPPLLRRTAGEPGYLGGRYVRDAGTRTAISVGALITAMALFVALVIMIHSFRKTVELWVTQSISGDLYLRPKMAGANQYRDTLPPEVVTTLKALKAPVDLVPYRRVYLHYDKVPYQFEVLDFEGFNKHAQLLFVTGDPQHILPPLVDGKGVLVSEVFANQTGIGVGKRFRAQIGQTHLDLPVLAVIRDYRTQGGVVYYSMAHFQELSGDTRWSGVRFNLRAGRAPGDIDVNLLQSRVLQALDHRQYGVEITLGRDLRHAILKIFDETFAITTVLLLIALAIATLGITSTLTVLVLDRARQFHTILACGGTRGQIRQMIFWEALIMVLAGELLGLACGFLLSYLLVFVINRQSFGWTFAYTVDWLPLVASFPLVLATALLAALPAGQIVFKRSPAMVLREP